MNAKGPDKSGTAQMTAWSATNAAEVPALPSLEVVHEGRGGFIAIDTCRYPIEHLEGGHFSIHFPAGQRHPRRAAHFLALQQLAADESPKWHIEIRGKSRSTA